MLGTVRRWAQARRGPATPTSQDGHRAVEDQATEDRATEDRATQGRAAAISAAATPSMPLPSGISPGATEASIRLARGVTTSALWSARLLVVLLAITVSLYLLSRVWVVVLPVLLALILTTVLWPVARFGRRGLPDAAAALLALVGGLAVLGGVVASLVPAVTSEASELVDQVTDGLDDLQGLIDDLPVEVGDDQLGSIIDSAISQVQENVQSIATQVLVGIGSIGSAVVTLLLTLAVTFFFLKDGPRFVPWVGGLLGPHGAGHAARLGDRLWKTLTGFIWSQACVAFVDAIFIGLGLWFLDVPFALPLAVLVFFGAFIPIVGALITGALATLVALVDGGPTTALIVLGLIVVVQQLEGNVLQPFLVGKALRLHPVVVLLSVTAGGTLLGIVGAFLAVPVAAVFAVVFRYVRERLAADIPATPAAPAPAPSETARTATR